VPARKVSRSCLVGTAAEQDDKSQIDVSGVELDCEVAADRSRAPAHRGLRQGVG
jgi:hypothetical protein